MLEILAYIAIGIVLAPLAMVVVGLLLFVGLIIAYYGVAGAYAVIVVVFWLPFTLLKGFFTPKKPKNP